jgi:hypothetical protein
MSEEFDKYWARTGSHLLLPHLEKWQAARVKRIAKNAYIKGRKDGYSSGYDKLAAENERYAELARACEESGSDPDRWSWQSRYKIQQALKALSEVKK